MFSPRMGINVGQDSRTGRRFIQGLNFRRQQGGGQAGFNRARARNMRIANRMSGGKGLDMRLHGEDTWRGGLPSGRGVRRTHVNFDPRGFGRVLHGGVHQKGPYKHTFVYGDGRRSSWQNDNFYNQQRLGPWAREYMRTGGRVSGLPKEYEGKKMPYTNFREWKDAVRTNKYYPGSRSEDYLEHILDQGNEDAMFSDRRLKTDIEPMGASLSGITIYQFRYAKDGPLYQGVIAQELLNTHPDAVITMPNGYYGVRYDLIDVDFVKLSEKELALNA